MAVTERRTQIYLTEEQYAAAMRLAQERGASLAAVVRDALDRLLATADREHPAPWGQDAAGTLAGCLDLPPLSAGQEGEADLNEAIDRSVYAEV